jgi:uncharacterized repeat protein (TIGR03803 family)
MQGKMLTGSLRATLAIFAMTLFVTGRSTAAERVLHNFQDGGRDGHKPVASLIFDAAGNLYGTSAEGGTGVDHCNTGTGGCGTVFELTPKGDGTWEEKVLHSFTADGKDGTYPTGSLVFDSSGNLYGTTSEGGAHTFYGTVFELSPAAGGKWKEKILHSFNYGTNEGSMPAGNLILDASGNLYGTTSLGGVRGYGTVFELMPAKDGTWTQKLLHSFKGSDGYSPMGGLTRDAAGNLFGTTIQGANQTCFNGYGCGLVFELTPQAGGNWSEKVLWSFNGNDGEAPSPNLLLDASGNIYGTTALGGDLTCDSGNGCGTVFELTRKKGGSWTETLLHIFRGKGNEGFYPEAELVLDASGNLYSTTYQGGDLSCYYGYGCGTVFELTPKTGGKWAEKVLYTFSKNGVDGSGPVGGLIFDHSGNLYGTTMRGGDQSCGAEADGCGTVFEITP